MNTRYENLNVSQRIARFGISMIAIVVAMESTLAGSTAFAVVNMSAIALATLAIIGWGPLKALFKGKQRAYKAQNNKLRHA